MNEVETMDASQATIHLQPIVRALSDLHMKNRDKDEVIVSQQKQIKMMRESVEYANDRYYKAQDDAHIALTFMYLAFIVAGIAIGYAVWIS